MNSKNELRRELLKKRKNDPEKDKMIFNKTKNLPQFKNAETILSYVSIKSEQANTTEIDTFKLIKYCLGNKRICVPKTFEREIIFYEITAFDDMEIGTFGILEPKSKCKKIENILLYKSVCIVPALACNEKNHRIGYGKGYYDRFLKNYNGYSIILCYKDNIIDFFEDENDVQADIVITE